MALIDSTLSKFIAIAIILVICSCIVSQYLGDNDQYTLANAQHATINACIGALVGITIGEWADGLDQWLA